jgi:Na+-transporting NADH:ubiquinone oxidoreductase subunit NqrB
MQNFIFSINIYFAFIRIFLTLLLCNFFVFLILRKNYTVMHYLLLVKDARYFQIVFQSLFLSYGIFYLGWQAEWWLYSTYFLVSFATQLLFESIAGKKEIPLHKRIPFALPSVIISSFGLSLLLKTNDIEIAALAAFVSIASKFLIRVKGKHIFNPSAFGIVVGVFVTGKAWFSPGQWGSGAVILFGVCCLGFIVATRIQKLDTSIAFLGTFAGLLFIRQVIYLGWPLDFFVQSVSTGSLLLFSFFMITDPKTIPDHRWARVCWCVAIACISFYLATFRFMNGAPILVLVLAQPLVPLMDKFFKAKKFEWRPAPAKSVNDEEFLQVVYSRSSM